MFKSRIAGEVPGLRRRPTTSRSAAPGGSTATPSSPSPPPAWRWPTPSSTSAREDPDRVGAMMGTALGGVAHGEQNYHAFLTEGPRAVDPGARAHGLRRRGQLQHRDRVRLHRPQLHQRDELRLGRHRHRRRLPRHRPGRRRRDARRRRRGAARPALLRRLRHHPGDVHPQRRSRRTPAARSTRAATASSWPRAPRCWCSRSGAARWRGARRSTPRSAGSA